MASSSSNFTSLLGLFVITLTLFHYPTLCSSQTLFVFGDSLYDAGNKQFLTKSPVPANRSPYGKSIGKATGRWSDGLIVPDFIAGFMSIPMVQPVLNTTADLTHGASFAVADATVLGSPRDSMTLAIQGTKFANTKSKWTDKERAAAIYLFYIGSNDYLNYTTKHKNPSKQDQTNFINQVILGIENALKNIYQAGGRRFAFQNLAPLGCLPIVKQQYANGNKCVKLPSDMAEEHNKKLHLTLARLAQTLDGFRFTTFNYFSSTQRRVDNSEKYSNVACCGSGSHNAFACGLSKGVSVCSKPSDFLFFDGSHYTQAANEQMAHLLFSADPQVVNPMNLRELLVVPLDAPIETGLESNAQIQFVLKSNAQVAYPSLVDAVTASFSELESGSKTLWSITSA